jgi:DNA-binding PadR family transcriptional regulator
LSGDAAVVGSRGGGGDELGFDHLEEINDLVLHVWDAAVLRCLLELDRPVRYSDIGDAVARWSEGRRPKDGDVTRSLERLRRAGFVRRVAAGTRRGGIYTLTSSGRLRAGKIDTLIAVLEADDAENELTRTHQDTQNDRPIGDGAG